MRKIVCQRTKWEILDLSLLSMCQSVITCLVVGLETTGVIEMMGLMLGTGAIAGNCIFLPRAPASLPSTNVEKELLFKFTKFLKDPINLH